jgi:hypothetical protein
MNIYNDLIHDFHLIIYVVPHPPEGFRKPNLVSDSGLPYLTELMQCIDSKIDTTVPSIDKYIKSFVEAVPSINRKRFRITQMQYCAYHRLFRQLRISRWNTPASFAATLSGITLGKLIMRTFILVVSCERNSFGVMC